MVAADVSLTVVENVLSDAVSGTGRVIYIAANSSLLITASESGVSINASTGVQVRATECANEMIATSAQVLEDHGWPLEQVLFVDNYFIEAIETKSFGGMDLPTPWTVVIVQEVDCSEGFTVGIDNQTWCVSLSMHPCRDSSFSHVGYDGLVCGLQRKVLQSLHE